MKKRILTLLLSIILILCGCSAGKDGGSNQTGDNPDSAKSGGVLNLTSYSPDTMNPLVTQYSCVRDFLYLIYEGLFIVNEDLSVKPVLATDYTISENNTVYTINLAKGIRFHNDSEFNASDVIATFEYIQNYGSIYADNLSNVAAYNKSGEDTIIITLKSPQANFVNNLDFPILPSGLSKGDFEAFTTAFTPIGTGRYVYAETIPYEGIELVKNESWHGSSRVYIPKVSVRFVKDNDGMLYAFDSGESDIITTERGRWGEFSYTGSYRTGEITTTKYTYLGLNTKNTALADTELRAAIADVIDKKLLTDALLFSHASIANSPVTSKAYFASAASEKDKDNDNKKERIDFLKKKRLSMYLLYNEESQQKKNIAEYLQKLLGEVGIKIQLSSVDFETYCSKISSGDYQMFIGEVDMSSDMNIRFMFDSAPTTPEHIPEEAEAEGSVVELPEEMPVEDYISTSMFSNFTSTELDNLIYSMNIAANENDAAVAYKNFEEYFEAYAIHIPLFHSNDAIFVNNRIKGKIKTNLTNFYADFGELYIDYDE